MTISKCAGNSFANAMHTCRSRRDVRCRITAFPTALETTKPNRGPMVTSSASEVVSYACTTTVCDPTRRPRLIVRRNCVGDVSLYEVGSTDYAVSFARPFLRRAATIARPARVDIRVRKPCLRARRRLFGWNVRFPFATIFSSKVHRARHTKPVLKFTNVGS